jgi:hypothetical protein
MDDCRFDNWTRLIGGETDRRSAVKGFAGGVAALLTMARAELGLAQDADLVVEAKNCKATNGKCQKDNDCCSLNCKLKKKKKKNKKEKGTCKCSGQGNRCKRDSGCCNGVCRSGTCDCGEEDDFCSDDGDCCSRKCENGSCRCGRQGDRCNDNRACCSNSCNGNGFCNS